MTRDLPATAQGPTFSFAHALPSQLIDEAPGNPPQAPLRRLGRTRLRKKSENAGSSRYGIRSTSSAPIPWKYANSPRRRRSDSSCQLAPRWGNGVAERQPGLLTSGPSWARHERRGASGVVRNKGSDAVRGCVVPLLGVIRRGCSDDAHGNKIDAGAGSRPRTERCLGVTRRVAPRHNLDSPPPSERKSNR
jgi:hypothetical protein